MKAQKLSTVSDMRSILADEVDRLRKGGQQTTPGTVNAIVNACGKILSSIKLEMEYNKMLGLTPNIGFINVEKSKPRNRKQVEASTEQKKISIVK